MDREDFNRITLSLLTSSMKYPNCSIANCNCNEQGGEWIPGCHCFGHFFMMDKEFGQGKENWNLGDFDASARVGRPIKAASANT